MDTHGFILRAKEAHGEFYDYSKTIYKDSNTKLCIICPVHGEIWQYPHNHLRGCGCKYCGRLRAADKWRKTTEEYVTLCKTIHGDRYDYSKTNFIHGKERVHIICPIHGEFWQIAANHQSGQGCPICGGSQKLTTQGFVEKAKEIHGDKYDYSKVEYHNIGTKVCIICPEHGEFWMEPENHLYLQQGCPLCKKFKSNLESDVETMLQNNNIQYIYQHATKWLGRQSLDFYLPEYNVAIECQGGQHFFAVKFFGGEEGLKIRQKRDANKKRLCRENGVRLLYFLDEEYVPYLKPDDEFFTKAEDLIKILHQPYNKT